MCQMCKLILLRLHDKGLVSRGNIEMCRAEIMQEIETVEKLLTPEQLNELLGEDTDIPLSEMN